MMLMASKSFNKPASIRALFRSSHVVRPAFRVFTSSQMMSVEEMNQQKAEFDVLKKELYDLKEKSVTVINSRGKEEEADAETLVPPNTISDLKRSEHLMSCDRTLIDFKSEIRSLYIHEQDF